MIELDSVAWWPHVTHEGVVYAVAPRYIAGAAITDALALQNGAELPSVGLVDAIWRAADVRCDAERLVRIHNGSHAQMASAAVLEDQRIRVEMEIARVLPEWTPPSPGHYPLIDGTHKSIVRLDSGRIGIYGWHKLDGTVIQEPTPVHAKGYYDYSQGLRLCVRVG